MKCFFYALVTCFIGTLEGCRFLNVENANDSQQHSGVKVKQLTFDSRNHYLSPYGVFSPDSQWLVYDTRAAETAMGSNPTIEKVNVNSGQIKTVYQISNQTPYGPGCGTPTYHPHKNKIIFIHGIKNADQSRPYDFHRRTCVMVDENQPHNCTYLDARDVVPPFTPGALRGGTHAHQFSGDGNWIGFTYNDALMAEIEKKTGYPLNLRTVGVMTATYPIYVDQDAEGENNDGSWFAALVARVVPFPLPGTDEICRAFDNAWVGKNGYLNPDGTRQKAQAYFGKLKTADGLDLVEVYISEIPNSINIPGPMGPLEGTADDFPMPPKGVVQRRLTFMQDKKYPGVSTEPRHWPLSSSDGQYIAFLAKDDRGIVQIFVISPLGSQPIQITFNGSSVQDTFSWKPDSHTLCYPCENRLFVVSLEKGEATKPYAITKPFETHPCYPCWSNDGNTIAFNRDIPKHHASYRQIFIIEFK